MNGLGKVVGCGTVEATLRQHTQPELDSLRHLEPVQLTEQRSRVVMLPCRED